jgi:hypothetical protein
MQSINQTLIQFMQRLVADRIGNQGTEFIQQVEIIRYLQNGLPFFYRLCEEHGGAI